MGRYTEGTLERMRRAAKKRILEKPWTSPIGPNGPWNKGLKGIHLSPKSEFKRGEVPKNSLIFVSREVKFKGSIKEYKSLHYRVNKTFGKPSACDKCGTSGLSGKNIHWANVSGEYREVREDWIRLCAKCHYIFDGHDNRRRAV